MIKINTVFILGAGASVDFDYPIGKTLRNLIINRLINKSQYVTQLAKVFIGRLYHFL